MPKEYVTNLDFQIKSTPEQIEQDLLKIIPQKYYKDINHLFIWHGRNICTARNPKCSECPVQTYCKNFTKTA